MKVTKSQLTNKPENRGRHVVILGAGASVAAFPEGNLPTMDNLIEVLRLETLLEQSGIEYQGRNFEAIYSDLYTTNPESVSLKKIDEAVHTYFSNLRLPEQPTLYDHLVLSLRQKDLIATFNWDPFLFEAWKRNRHTAELPNLAFLHGNVRIGYCSEHGIKGENGYPCPKCNKEFTPSRLLYPITMKNYSDDPFIEKEWELLKNDLRKAYIITIFGYSAPRTDKEAIDIMQKVWDKDNRLIERIEVIDIKKENDLQRQWDPFIVQYYFDYSKDFYQSRIPNYPRRSCEAFLATHASGYMVENNPIPKDADFEELTAWIKPLVEAEQALEDDTKQD